MPWANKLHSFGEEFSGRLAYRHTKVEKVSTHPFRNHLRPKAFDAKVGTGDSCWKEAFLNSWPCWKQQHPVLVWSIAEFLVPRPAMTSFTLLLPSLIFPYLSCYDDARCASLQLYSVMWRSAKVKSTCKFPLVPLRLSGVISVRCLAHVSSAAITGVPLPFSSQCVKMTVTNDPEDIYQGLGLKTFI